MNVDKAPDNLSKSSQSNFLNKLCRVFLTVIVSTVYSVDKDRENVCILI